MYNLLLSKAKMKTAVNVGSAFNTYPGLLYVATGTGAR